MLPDGQIFNVNDRSHPDLAWALRGAGSSNFGIVSSFVVKAFKLPNPNGIWYGAGIYAQDQIASVLDGMQEIWTTDNKDIMHLNLYSFDSANDAFHLAAVHGHMTHDVPNKDPESLTSLAGIPCIPILPNKQVMSLAAIAEMVERSFPSLRRNIWQTFTYRPLRELDHSLYSIFEAEVAKLKDAQGFQAQLGMQFLPQSSEDGIDKSCLGDSTGPENGPLVLLSFGWAYDLPADDKRMEEAAIRCLSIMEERARALKAWHPFKYVNYAYEKHQPEQIWEGYGAGNAQRLKTIQASIDPTGIFTSQGLASGYFKLN